MKAKFLDIFLSATRVLHDERRKMKRILTLMCVAVLVAASGQGYADPILIGTGPTMNVVPGNLANAPGATAFALDELDFGGLHLIKHLNDGLYGNSNSWIGNGAIGSSGPFAGINLNGLFTIDGFAFGRDNTQFYRDRSDGTYTVQVTTVANPGSSTPDVDWSTLGEVNISSSAIRKIYSITPVNATGFRLLVPSTGLDTGTAIDEIEVFGTAATVPEPSATLLFAISLLGLVGYGWRSRWPKADHR
jgi:hypothetical protein